MVSLLSPSIVVLPEKKGKRKALSKGAVLFVGRWGEPLSFLRPVL
jgi:hypothetical protein